MAATAAPRRLCFRCGRVFQSWLGLEAHLREHATAAAAAAPVTVVDVTEQERRPAPA